MTDFRAQLSILYWYGAIPVREALLVFGVALMAGLAIGICVGRLIEMNS